MPGFLTTAHKLALLRSYFGAQALAAPATLYVGALTTAPAADGTGSVEVSAAGGTNYARVALTNNGANLIAGTGASVKNANQITFAEAGANWGDVVGIAIYDSAVASVPIGYAPAPKTITTTDTYYVAANSAVIELLNVA